MRHKPATYRVQGPSDFYARFLINFSKDYVIERFSYLDQEPFVHEDMALDDPAIATNFGCRYGCAIFELTKK